MQSHEPQAQAAVLLPGLANLGVRHLRVQRTTQQERGSEPGDVLHFFFGLDVSEVDRT